MLNKKGNDVMKLISIGCGNFVSDIRIVSIVAPDSAPVKRLVQEARENGMLIDATFGRKTKCVLVMDSSHVILSAISPQNIVQKTDEERGSKDEE